MKNKIDDILDRVKDPESDLTIAQLGLVKFVRYNMLGKKLIIFLNPLKSPRLCCSIISYLIFSSIEKNLVTEFKKEFPDLIIEFS